MTRHLPWIALALAGAACLAVVAGARGEPVNALWIVAAAVSVYLVAYRYYARFLARAVAGIDPARPTPAVRRADGLDYVATDRRVLFGHHFAAIAGAGPLVGPVLAAQMGYLPGTLWILAGVVLAGAVQDFMILFISMRRDGRSLGELIRMEMGAVAGTIALVGAFAIMVIILAVLALIVVRALAESPWGLFTVAATVPLAMLMGAYTRWLRPGAIREVSLIGFAGLIAAIVLGQSVARSATLAPLFTFTPVQLCFGLIAYGAIASVLPVWLLLAPRDYLSTFLKIGAIAALAVGIVVMAPPLRMPALTPFAASGAGPVWAGPLFPFLFITIACGAVSGFHALIASGTTPKLIASEADAPFIGYGAMLMESAVAIMALVAASILDPGIYFAMNAPAAVLGTDPASAAAAVTAMGFPLAPETLARTAHEVGEATIISRTGGAPTLAVAMAEIFSHVAGGTAMKAFWYHFAILFEALFILTAVDAGTRAGRFMLQDLVGLAVPRFREGKGAAGLLATALCVGAWGFFLYQGVTDPLGGVNTLWPLFGISNQMLAAVALMLATAVLFRMKRQRFAWATILPAAWLVLCTGTAGLMKLFHPDPKIGFLAHARRFAEAAARGELLPPARSVADMGRIVMNDRIDAGLCALFLAVVAAILVYTVRTCRAALRTDRPTASEVPPAMVPVA
ncbi:carbon starvation protein A [Sphingomonas metalli]|uniref:Carbon starvation protein A n=1 Tax=Sphingomonas metalli TaxID=1779358 RepID=A0A916SYB8_9SPHN|nr:carbon starvation CstA family protein [Sphingomonas metalli]GGB22692.1 carbon starvation protein A [Sphingomonas metalli]